MANPFRGEADLVLQGRIYRLRLTLGALAELEQAFKVEGLGALGERLSAGRLSARDLLRLLVPLLRAGGENLTPDELAGRIGAVDLPAVVEALSACFAAALPGEETASP